MVIYLFSLLLHLDGKHPILSTFVEISLRFYTGNAF